MALSDCERVEGPAVGELLRHSRFPDHAKYYLRPNAEAAALVHHGNLHIDGDFVVPLNPEGPFDLLVLGDLVITGRYADCDDPQCSVLVTGNLSAKVVVTNGRLEVGGDLTADMVLGDYNDHLCQIGGTLRCRVFFPEEHFFEAARAEIEVALGLTEHRLELAEGKVVCADAAIEANEETGDERELYAFYRQFFVDELVGYDDIDEEDGSVFDVYVMTSRANGLIREGLPVVRD